MDQKVEKHSSGNVTAAPSLANLVQSFIEQAYCKTHQLSKESIELIGQFLEEEISKFQGASEDTLSPQDFREWQAFEKTKGIYCELLLALDAKEIPDWWAKSPEQILEDDLNKASAKQPLATHPGQSPAKQNPYVQVAALLHILKDQTSQESESALLDRLKGITLAFSIEHAWFKKIQPTLETFWRTRNDALHLIVDPASKNMELHPRLIHAIDSATQLHSEWLYKGRFLDMHTRQVVQYILSVAPTKRFIPNLIDMSFLLLLFGQEKALSQYPLKNHLGIDGLSDRELLECVFLLSRAQRMKSKFTSALSRVSAKHSKILEQDAHRLNELNAKINVRQFS